MKSSALTLMAGTFTLAALLQLDANAYVAGRYGPDTYTLHLWHFDETNTPVADFGSNPIALTNLAGGATLGNSSLNEFGMALNTADGGQSATAAAGKDALLSPKPMANSSADNVSMAFAGADGAFTFEAVVRVDFDPALNYGATTSGGSGRVDQMQIFSGEDEANGGRIFQFRVDPIGTASGNTVPRLRFINLHAVSSVQEVAVDIPTSGPNAIVSNQWYHVAVVYDGVENGVDNIKLYWTWLDQLPSPKEANLIGTSSMQYDLSTGATDFCIGNEGRNPASGNFVGLIDEVRISSIGRAANNMQLIDPVPLVVVQPLSQIVAVGQPVTLAVTAGGAMPLSYQWRYGGAPIDGATQSAYPIAAAKVTDIGNYDVVVSNSFGKITSDVAVLTVRDPLNLTWAGFLDWDTNNVNWDTTGDGNADRAYIEGDNVLFNGQGASYVILAQQLHPSSVVVNSASDYTFTTTTGGGISKNTGLTKDGAGTLTLATPNTYTGPTVIQAGALQVGTGGAVGSLGSGPVTNNGSLIMDSTSGATIPLIGGTGALTNLAGATLLNGTNSLSGPLAINAGSVTLSGLAAQGSFSSVTLNASGSPYSVFNIGDGMTFGAGVSFSMLGSTASPDTRCAIGATSGTNSINGPITIAGDGVAQFSGPANGTLELNGPITGPSFFGKLIIRGAGTNHLSGSIQIGGHVSVTDSGTWTISSTGNSWTNTDVAGGRLRLGAAGALPSTITLNVYNGVLDLNGFNQQVAILDSFTTSGALPLNPNGMITNSSATSDAVFTLAATRDCVFAGRFADGLRKLGLSLAGGSLTLTNVSLYSGDTLINAGYLALTNNGSIGNSANIVLASGTAIVVTNRNDGSLTLNPSQTLKGAGAINVVGGLTNNGTIELKLNKSGITLAFDSIQALSRIQYGGSLNLNISGDPLATTDSFKLFNAASYSGAFASILPAPGPGLTWDTSTLVTDGTLRIKTGPSTTPTSLTTAVIENGSTLQLSWPADHTGWTLQAQTNATTTGLNTNWVRISTSASTNQVLLPIDKNAGAVFYRLTYP